MMNYLILSKLAKLWDTLSKQSAMPRNFLKLWMMDSLTDFSGACIQLYIKEILKEDLNTFENACYLAERCSHVETLTPIIQQSQ